MINHNHGLLLENITLIAYFGLEFHVSLNSHNTKASKQWGLMGLIRNLDCTLYKQCSLFCKSP